MTNFNLTDGLPAQDYDHGSVDAYWFNNRPAIAGEDRHRAIALFSEMFGTLQSFFNAGSGGCSIEEMQLRNDGIAGELKIVTYDRCGDAEVTYEPFFIGWGDFFSGEDGCGLRALHDKRAAEAERIRIAREAEERWRQEQARQARLKAEQEAKDRAEYERLRAKFGATADAGSP